MTRKVLDGDLLSPTLDEDYDGIEFRRPWRPWNLAVATFFGGLFTPVILYPLNYRRLGQPRAAKVALWVLLAYAVLVVAANLTYVISRGFDEWEMDTEARRIVRHVQRGIAVAPALWLSFRQQRRFRVFQGTGGKPGRLFWPALGAIAASIAATFVVWFVTLMLAYGDA